VFTDIFIPEVGCLVLSTVAVLGKILGGAGPSSFGRQQRLSEITIEPIKNLGAWARFGAFAPSPALALYRH